MNKRHRRDIGLIKQIREEKMLEAKRKRRPKLLIAILLMLLYGMSGSITTMVIADEATDQTAIVAQAEAAQKAEAEAAAKAQAEAAAKAQAEDIDS